MRALLDLALGSFIKEHLASVVDPLFSIPFPQFAVRVDPNLGPKKGRVHTDVLGCQSELLQCFLCLA